MQTQTHPCEEFEIASLRRARGAIDATALASLDAHLRTCAGCRGFAATAAATEAVLRGRVREASEGRDWDHVRARFQARRRTNRTRMLCGLASFAPLAAIGGWAFGPVAGTLFAVLLLGIPVFVCRRFIRPEERRALRAEAIDTEMLDFYRRDLDKEIMGLRGGRRLIIVLGMLFAWNLIFMAVKVVKELLLGHEFPNVENYAGTFVIFALIGGAMWLRDRYALPRLLRERAELGE